MRLFAAVVPPSSVIGELEPVVRGLEEMPEAYKDVQDVVDVMQGAGLSRKVARLVPIGVVKG